MVNEGFSCFFFKFFSMIVGVGTCPGHHIVFFFFLMSADWWFTELFCRSAHGVGVERPTPTAYH